MLEMGKKCCVPGCRSNFGKSKAKNPGIRERNNMLNRGRENIPMFGLPSKKKYHLERKRWIESIPGLIEKNVDRLKGNPSVCVKHWPSNFSTIKSGNGRKRPSEPPSIFECYLNLRQNEKPTAPLPIFWMQYTRAEFDSRILMPNDVSMVKAEQILSMVLKKPVLSTIHEGNQPLVFTSTHVCVMFLFLHKILGGFQYENPFFFVFLFIRQ